MCRLCTWPSCVRQRELADVLKHEARGGSAWGGMDVDIFELGLTGCIHRWGVRMWPLVLVLACLP